MQQTQGAKHKLFIANEWVPASDGRESEVRNPATNEVIAHAAAATRDDARKAVDAAQVAFDGAWGALTPSEKGKLLWKWAQVLTDRREVIAEVETVNQGK